MVREITAAAITASNEAPVRPVILAAMDFSSGWVRVNSGVSSVVYDSNTYLGIGAFGSVSPVEEVLEMQEGTMNLSLTGVDTAYISLALNEHYQGRAALIYVALLDADHVLIDDPVLLFQGRMDNMEITLGNQGTIQVTCTNPMVDWERPRTLRYNNETQQLLYPGDKGLEFVAQSSEKQVYWGTNKPVGG